MSAPPTVFAWKRLLRTETARRSTPGDRSGRQDHPRDPLQLCHSQVPKVKRSWSNPTSTFTSPRPPAPDSTPSGLLRRQAHRRRFKHGVFRLRCGATCGHQPQMRPPNTLSDANSDRMLPLSIAGTSVRVVPLANQSSECGTFCLGDGGRGGTARCEGHLS